MSYTSNATMAEIAARVDAAKRVMITTHSKPDGDALGSALALARAVTRLGRAADIFYAGALEPCLRAIAGATPLHDVADGLPGDSYDLAVVLDTGAWSQLRPIRAWLEDHHDIVVGLDHHSRGDEVAAARVVDSSRAATALLVTALLDELGWPLRPGRDGEAEPLFVALATDTGWFRYPNADAGAFDLAARLLSIGVDSAGLYELIEQTHRRERLSLEARALGSLTYGAGGAAAVMTLRASDFTESGGSVEDLTGIVNLPMIVGDIRLSVLLVEVRPDLIKMSFRSKPAESGRDPADFIDVNALADHFGGGGHVHAAGARVEKDLEQVQQELERLIAAIPRR